MAKNRESVTTNGKAAFYACMWPDLREAALNCGWALGLHGSLASDMDIMAMPWTEEAKSVEEMIQALSDCFTENPFKDRHTVPHFDKPNGRVVYTMSIWADFYLDINVINYKLNETVGGQMKDVNVELLEALKRNKRMFDVIVADCKSLTYTSEHHRLDTILGRAIRSSEYIKKHYDKLIINAEKQTKP